MYQPLVRRQNGSRPAPGWCRWLGPSAKTTIHDHIRTLRHRRRARLSAPRGGRCRYRIGADSRRRRQLHDAALVCDIHFIGRNSDTFCFCVLVEANHLLFPFRQSFFSIAKNGEGFFTRRWAKDSKPRLHNQPQSGRGPSSPERFP